jgi:hypothetical protein
LHFNPTGQADGMSMDAKKQENKTVNQSFAHKQKILTNFHQ